MTIEKPDARYISQLWDLWREAFGDSGAFLEAFFSTAYSPERCLCVLDNQKVAAAVYWFDCELRGQKIAYIYALATAMVNRSQGIAHRLMERTHNQLTEQGYQGIVLVPGIQALRGFYETLGYRDCCPMVEFVCAGGPDEVQLRRATPEEYAWQRRDLFSLLEPAGVIQEGENMSFLATQADLYIGQNFLLAARGEGDTLIGIELLGDPQMAPGIVRALGYTTGTFRTRGQGNPFAMYHPLGDSTLAPPTYFGLAFD